MTANTSHLTWRPMVVSDAAAMADLLNAVDAEDHVWGQYTEEDAADELGSPVTDLPTSTLAVFEGSSMLGFSAVHHQPAAEVVHRVQAAGAVRPTHRRQGLGTTLLRHGLETATTLHARHHPVLPLVVETIYGEHVHGAVALYRAAGMTATQWVRHMRRPLDAAVPIAPVPDRLRLESYAAETDEEFRSVCNEAYQDQGTAPLSAEEWKVWAVNANFRPELSFLLRDVETGTAAGMLLTISWDAETEATGIRDAHLRILGTRPAYRGRGAAGALMSHALRSAQARGYERASLRVAADGPSPGLRLAERAGFVTHDTQVHYSLEL